MGLFSKQTIYCNNCGCKVYEAIPRIIGKDCKVCSMKCLDEFKAKQHLSMLGKPEPTPPAEEKQ